MKTFITITAVALAAIVAFAQDASKPMSVTSIKPPRRTNKVAKPMKPEQAALDWW
jgi:hypothetical protein